MKGHLPSKVVFHQRSSAIEGWLLSKVIFVFHQRSIPLHLKHLVGVPEVLPLVAEALPVFAKIKSTPSHRPGV